MRSSAFTAENGISVTVLLAARNEAANLSRCLAALRPAAEIVVVDSGSVDNTPEIARDAGARVLQFEHTGGYPKKRQWALEMVRFKTAWVLLLDADEVVPEALWAEIATAVAADGPDAVGATKPVAYLIKKGFHFLGRRFRFGGFSFDAMLLVRPERVRFERLIEVPGDTLDMEVHERLIVDGPVGRLNTPLIHEDFKGLEAYIDKHNRYSTWEAHLRHQFLTSGEYGEESVQPRLFGNPQERRRWLKRLAIRTPGEPWLWFAYHYLFKLGFLEGTAGKIACQIRADYIRQVRAKMYELRLKDRHEAGERRH
ncbi:glycosyltransferase family 2 protein [Candidatus Laterigemmans baculatus]|uniref:glycosyltransferase family 2 protein n=1 Tax=Candidatus Laterigemmans baculatus TaxID=2770505 RepID=UPI0013DB8F1C|nr:glycosyltransferase family 2 protein [Candidatus Laterigemmans baculatus]